MSGKLVLETDEDDPSFLVVKPAQEYISETVGLIDGGLSEEEVLASLQSFIELVNRHGDYGPRSRTIVS
jgi:hypothetical protein